MSEDSDYEYEMKGKHPINPFIFDSKWRVKLYKLNYTGQWDDLGTGYVSIINEVYFKINIQIFRTKIISSKCFLRLRTIKYLNLK